MCINASISTPELSRYKIKSARPYDGGISVRPIPESPEIILFSPTTMFTSSEEVGL